MSLTILKACIVEPNPWRVVMLIWSKNRHLVRSDRPPAQKMLKRMPTNAIERDPHQVPVD
jgi:hypothetical protein